MAVSRAAYDAASPRELSASLLTRRASVSAAVRRVVLGLLVATLVALLFAAQGYAFASVEGQPRSWWRLLSVQLVLWYTWAALFPLIVALAARWPLVRHGSPRRIALWIVAAVVFAGLHAAIAMTALVTLHVIKPPAGVVPSLGYGIWVRFLGSLAANLFDFALAALAIHVHASQAEARERDRREAELTARLAEAELHVLKAQLQPHFFFNTLNTVSALMDTNVESARTVMANLGDLLRLSMHRLATDETVLVEEFVFIDKYLAIQRARYGARLEATLQLDPAVKDALVPSLILQPLVENAVRYAIETRRTPGAIRISASARGDMVHLVVEDDGPGMAPDVVSGARRGVGLQNTETRLRQLYGDAMRFEIGSSDVGGARVVIELPLRVPR